MRWPLILRRRFDAEIAAAKADVERLRARTTRAEAIARAEVEARRTITRQHAELDAANTRLAGRNRTLQDRLDDACGLNSPAVAAGRQWQDRRADKPHTAKEQPS